MTQSTTQTPRRSALGRLLSQRSVQLTIVAWLAANALVLWLGSDGLPLDRPSAEATPVGQHLVFANAAMLQVFLLMWVVYALTRRRTIPDVAARAPQRDTARREVLWLIAYAILAQAGGYLLGMAFDWHAFGFHIAGTLYGTDDVVTPAEVYTWSAYNFIAYVVLPFAFFRRRYSSEQLNLRSSDRRNDILVIVVILAIESAVELLALDHHFFGLTASQLLLGVPLTFALYFLGTVMPTMIFIYCILVPRFLKLSGSVATTVILGGLTYALLHIFDGWARYDTLDTAALSLCLVLLQYFGPGMIKTVLTLRTGNAWVHVWAYHAIAPHVIADTHGMVKIFGIK